MARLRLVAVAAAFVVLCSGCKTRLNIGVEANGHGGGDVVATIALDKAAQAIVGDLKGKLDVDDLTRAGWKITGPTKADNGEVAITARKAVKTLAGVERAIKELDGDSGLFKNFRVTQDKGLLQTKTRFSGSVDLRRGIESFSDEALRKTLGSPLGATEDEFAARIGTVLSEALPINVVANLPGDVDSNAPVQSSGQAVWRPKLGDRIELVATAKKWNVRTIGFGAVAVLALGSAAIFGRGARRRHT